jgi:hypothetical protein
MATEPSPDLLDDDIAQRLRAAGIVVPADRLVGTTAAARRLLSVLHWLRTPLAAAAEPAAILVLGEEARG